MTRMDFRWSCMSEGDQGRGAETDFVGISLGALQL